MWAGLTRHQRRTVLWLLGFILTGSVQAVERPTTVQRTCVTGECHASYAEKPFVHGPVGLGECKSCHEAVDPAEHTYKLSRQGRDLCEYCHLDPAAQSVVHEPLKQGDCLQCHNPHASEGKYLLKEKTVAGLCAECHQVTEGKAFLHGPTAVGECTVCHNPHSSDHENLLTQERTQLCVSCHVTTQEQLSKYAFIHEPAKGDCAGCHDPHGSNTPHILKAEAPQLCFSCHENIKKIAETSTYRHKPVLEKDGCLNCHTPHASTVRYLMKDNPATLCLNCHNKPQAIDQNDVLPAFTPQIENKKYLHGPVRDKSCSGCHMAHGSNHYRLLAKAYPPEFYAPYSRDNYALCFSCHSDSLVEAERTTTLTNFRDGDRNLHFVHVDKAERGRTCRACHETHGSNLPSHLRETTPFGMWNLPIGYVKTENGGSCTPGCHVQKTYNRIMPEDRKATDGTASQ